MFKPILKQPTLFGEYNVNNASHTSTRGGWSEPIFQPFDKEFLDVVGSVAPEIREQLLALPELASFAEPVSLPNYVATVIISYRQQVVAGMNYNVNMLLVRSVDSEDPSESLKFQLVGVEIFKPLPYTGKPAEVIQVSAAPIS